MSKKTSIIIICIIIVISLGISIYIPNRDKIEETEDSSVTYFLIEKEGKYGIGQNDEIIIKPQYDNIIIPNEHRAVFLCSSEEGESKFVNSENREIFKEYEKVSLIEVYENKYEKNILTYYKDGKYGLLGITGKVITENKYEEIYSLGYKEGEVIVKENNKYGIIDEKGNVKIKNEYDAISSDEYYTKENEYKKSGYVVQKTTSEGYRYGYYDSEGIQVLKEEYNQIKRLTQIQSNDIYLIAAKNGQYGVFINNSKIINTQYQQIEYNSDMEIFIVERTGKYGIININGLEIIKPEYPELQIKGMYIYTVNGEEKKVWDTNGKEVNISFDTVIQKTNSEYYIKNEEGNYSILNSNFEQISENNFKYIEYAYNDYFIATNEQDKTGIIDSEGNVHISYYYDVIQVMKGKKVIQCIDFSTDFMTFYDKDLYIITEMLNAEIKYYEDSFLIYNYENENGLLLDNDGKLIKNDD